MQSFDSLLAVQSGGVSKLAMNAVTLLALFAAPTAPIPLTETHQRDIGCVATLALVAADQKAGRLADVPAVGEPGRRWAGIVGQRIVDETAQPRELVAIAMNEAAKAQVSRNESAAARQTRIANCTLRMQSDLAAADAANAPLPKPQSVR